MPTTKHRTISQNPYQRAASRENPFEIFERASYSHPQRQVQPPSHQYGHLPALETLSSNPDILRQKRQARRQAFLRKKRPTISLKSSVKWLLSLLAGFVIVFSLLPMKMQRQCFAYFGLAPISIRQLITHPLPLNYDYISSPFGKRWGRQHQGIDFAAPQGEPIYAMAAGTVIHSGWEPGYGKSVVIDHGKGMQTRYAHCSKLLVKVGQAVLKAAPIAKVGSTGHSTGPHLHFEVVVDGVRKNPAWFFAFEGLDPQQMAQAKSE